MMTLVELKGRLSQEFDEVTLLEMMEVDAEELVELLSDKIEERFDQLITQLGEDEWVA